MMSVRKPRALVAASTLTLLIGLGGALLPSPAFADSHDHAAPIQAADSSGLVANEAGSNVYSSGGAPVMTNAWCDPLTNTCDRHPWVHHDSRY
jgi:hypothetical protein